MEPRTYQPQDCDACLAIFDSNSLTGRAAFEQFLNAIPADFTVLEHDGQVVGCGGYRLANGSATLEHGMIHRNFQRMGLGRFLLLYRLRQISKSTAGGDIGFARLTAARNDVAFYQKQGFKPSGSTDAEHVDLVMKLTVCP